MKRGRFKTVTVPERPLNIRIPAILHQQLKIYSAANNVPIKNIVISALKKNVFFNQPTNTCK